LKFPAFTLPNFPALFCAYCHFAPPGGGSGAVYGVAGHKKAPAGCKLAGAGGSFY